MARVEIAVPVFLLQVGAIQRENGAVFADFIQFMSPGVGKLGRQTVPGPDAEKSLKRVVVGSADAVELCDRPRVGILREKRPRRLLLHKSEVAAGVRKGYLVDVQHHRQLAAFAPDVSNLEHAEVADAFFDLQIEVIEIGRAEILVYGIDVVNICASRGIRRAAAGQGWTKRYSREDGRAANLRGLPVVAQPRVVVDRTGPDGIVLYAVRRCDGRPVV